MINEFIINKAIKYIRYIAIFIYLKNIISFNEKNYYISPLILKYHKLIIFTLLLAIIILSYYNFIPISIVLSIILIIYIDKYHNYLESFYVANDAITLKDVYKFNTKCKNNKWSTKNCQVIKKQIIEFCQKKIRGGECPPWDKNVYTTNTGKSYNIDCPKMYLELYPNNCKFES